MKFKWTKTSILRNQLGETSIAYANNKNDTLIESRRRAVPHSGRSGYWFYTTYFVVERSGKETECRTLMEAKELAEGVGE